MVTQSGRKKAKWMPGNLLEKYHDKSTRFTKGSKHPGSRGTGTKAPFIIIGKGGKAMLVRRKTKKSGPLEVLYIFAKKADIKETWHFEEKGYNFIKSNYMKYFEEALASVVRKYSDGGAQ